MLATTMSWLAGRTVPNGAMFGTEGSLTQMSASEETRNEVLPIRISTDVNRV